MGLLDRSTVYKPFQYAWAVDFAVAHEQSHWHEGEVELQGDIDQWSRGIVNVAEKRHITENQKLFTQSDVSVGTNYLEYYIPYFKNNEIRAGLATIANREFVHQRAYALLNDTLGFDDSDYSLFLENKDMKAKVEFMGNVNTHSQTSAAYAIAQSVINEGVGLYSAFAMLLNFQRVGKMLGMCKVVEWSIKDEAMHASFMIKLFREFCEEHPRIVNDDFKKNIYNMFRVEVALEDKIIDNAYPDGKEINGVGPKDIKQYIRFLADRRLIQLGLNSNWHVRENPIPWINHIIGGDSHQNFFEGRVADYTAKPMTGNWEWESLIA